MQRRTNIDSSLNKLVSQPRHEKKGKLGLRVKKFDQFLMRRKWTILKEIDNEVDSIKW